MLSGMLNIVWHAKDSFNRYLLNSYSVLNLLKVLITGYQNHQLEMIHSLQQLTMVTTNTSLISRMLFQIKETV